MCEEKEHESQLTGPLLAGYFLLAVLITRFAVMFQSLTP